MPEWLAGCLKDNEAVRMLKENRGPLPLSSLMQEALVISASYLQKPRPILVVKKNLYQAQRLFERVSSLLSQDECALFGADESLRMEALASSLEITAGKIDALSSLLEKPAQVVVTCPSGYLRNLPFPADFADACMVLKVDDVISMDDLKRKLRAGGYSETAHIDQPLSFACRGGIVDVFSINNPQPVRIEFFDNEIDSIRFFDPSTQKTVETIDQVRIVPASDVLFNEAQLSVIRTKAEKVLAEKNDALLSGEIESDLDALDHHIREPRMYRYTALLDKTACLADYMGHPLILYSDQDAVFDGAKHLMEETAVYLQEMVSEGKALPFYTMYHDIHHVASDCTKLPEDPLTSNISNIQEVRVPNEPLDIKLKLIDVPGKNVIVLNKREQDTVKDTLKQLKIRYHDLKDDGEIPDGISFYTGEYPEGFLLADAGVAVYTSNELFEVRHHHSRYEKKFSSAQVISGYDELNPGDYVVHAQYGVGQYVGIENRTIQGVRKDFLKIVYRGDAELLVPLEQFKLVRKFVSREGVVPRLNKLGSGEWEKTRAKLQENVNHIADRLIALYASREQHIGHAFSPDNEMTRRFENSFPYELTPDQQKAVEDVKRDMESDKPMDRLVCGDVGFGKTEVAVRASFKAVSDGYQTAVLCPTTILAEQHLHTFQKRYEGYPVTIRVLDRFQSAQDVKNTLEGLSKGTVDIVIGTHRLLSKDVHFKQLGLLVVDEEQRFGVEHKEKIKEMKNGIDVLTLSATPIPRTLQMSLIGIRSLSQLETPPRNRYSVQTYVAEKNQGLIVEAIEKELARHGQVYYLYNNIQQIYNVARTLRHLLPEARIGIVHGQMDREDIEDAMMRFTNHEVDVMVCTTIVENGIDIPNANTIIIDNAQDFGLAQMYQIKGRVGRSDREAYAYLLVPPRKQLSEVAAKRLQAVREFATMGSGYKIAMRDLTIRGAGDLLGPHQSGFIDTVGIDMYIEMLEEAIQKKTHPEQEEKKPVTEKHANVSVSGYIPKNFSANDYDKLDLYHQIENIRTREELDAYAAGIVDQYGKLPKAVQTLFLKKKLDLLLNEPYVQSYREVNGQPQITFSTLFSSQVDGVKLFEIFSNISKDIRIRYTNNTIIATLPRTKDVLDMSIQVMESAWEARKK